MRLLMNVRWKLPSAELEDYTAAFDEWFVGSYLDPAAAELI